MPPKDYDFQPGAILHDAIVGTFKANGGSFELWCRENGISPSLARLIEAAGEDFLRMAYSRRIAAYAAAVKKGAA